MNTVVKNISVQLIIIFVLLLIFAPIPVLAELLQSDDFDRANSDSLGSPWLEDSGDIDIVDNKAQGSGSNNIAVYTASPSATPTGHYSVSADIVLGSSSDGNIICRYQNFENFYKASLNTNGNLYVDRVINGSYTSLGSYYGGYSTGVSYNLKIECIGNTIKAYVNNVLRVTATDSTHTGGYGGIRVDSVGAVTFDNWQLEGTPSATPTPTPTIAPSNSPTPTPLGGIQYVDISSSSAILTAIGDVTHMTWLFFGIILFTIGFYLGMKPYNE